MKIVHLCLQAPYNDYWGYQDNLLPKYHKKLGHDVTVITTNTMHEGTKLVTIDTADYTLDDGQRIIRLDYVHFKPNKLSNAYRYFKIYDLLCDIRPDFIMVHGLGNISVLQVKKYVLRVNPQCTVIADNHLDYNIGKLKETFTNNLLFKSYKFLNKYVQGIYAKVYGVTPWREAYARDVFGIDPEKTDTLIMGADDEKIDFANREEIRKLIRSEHNVSDNEFLVVTGGKIDLKKKIHYLMKACREIPKVKLLVFGNVADDVRDEFNKLLEDGDNIIYIGWINADKVYDYFFAADLVFFPGQHSVLWEQACAAKAPCVFERWEGMEHVNNGGNSDFVSPVSVESIKAKIEELLFTEKYNQMKAVAESDNTGIYLYSNIAKKSLETVE